MYSWNVNLTSGGSTLGNSVGAPSIGEPNYGTLFIQTVDENAQTNIVAYPRYSAETAQTTWRYSTQLAYEIIALDPGQYGVATLVVSDPLEYLKVDQDKSWNAILDAQGDGELPDVSEILWFATSPTLNGVDQIQEAITELKGNIEKEQEDLQKQKDADLQECEGAEYPYTSPTGVVVTSENECQALIAPAWDAIIADKKKETVVSFVEQNKIKLTKKHQYLYASIGGKEMEFMLK